MGTRGDIVPFLGLARKFVAMEADVTVCTNANWEELVINTGAKFLSIAPADPPQTGRDDFVFFRENVLPSFRKSFRFVERSVRSGKRPWLIYRNNMLGLECATHLYQLPNAKIVLQPSGVQSVDRPPWPWSGMARGPWRLVYRALLMPAFQLAGACGKYRRLTNAFRREVGLAPVPMRRAQASNELTLLMCPQWFAQPQADWPLRTVCVGFPDQYSSESDREIEAFIQMHGPPLVFTPGTGVTDVQAFSSLAREICRRLRRPGIFLSKYANGLTLTASDTFVHRSFVDLQWLCGRACLLVHHGGIGTTAQAFRAGIPQIILPGRFDQPDNAMRVAELGLGAVVLDNNTSCEAWTATAARLLSDQTMANRLRRVSAAVKEEQAIATAASLICNEAKRWAV
jgi:rhamnosyltransferase subunit B